MYTIIVVCVCVCVQVVESPRRPPVVAPPVSSTAAVKPPSRRSVPHPTLVTYSIPTHSPGASLCWTGLDKNLTVQVRPVCLVQASDKLGDKKLFPERGRISLIIVHVIVFTRTRTHTHTHTHTLLSLHSHTHTIYIHKYNYCASMSHNYVS